MKHTYKNIFNDEVINGSVSLSAADPFIFKYNGYYYLTCTRANGLVFMKTFDLIHYEYVNDDGIVGAREVKSCYAPEVIYDNGYFYLVTSPEGNGHYLYKSKNIEGPFELISDNFHEMIDGSFFIDSDGKEYFLRASETGIVIKKFKKEDKLTDFKFFDDEFIFNETKIGGWTEGPYLLKRYGRYYLTYTGTHFLSSAYRVDYSSGKSIQNSNSLKRRGRLLLSTTKEYYGLGHSANFVGPNLDTYYITFHNMMDNGKRYANIAPIMFSKDEMLINGVSIEDNFAIERPLFETFVKGDYLSKEFNDKEFSIEYNFISSKAKLILGNHYFRVFKDKINLYQEENLIHTISLNREYKEDVYHCLRLQYKDNFLTLYLDLTEICYGEKIKLSNGKIGYQDNQLKDAYLAYSPYAYGSSQYKAIKRDEFFVDNLETINGIHQGEIFIQEDGYYHFIAKRNDGNIEVDGDKLKLTKYSYGLKYLERGIHSLTYQGKAKKIKYFKANYDIESYRDDFYEKGDLSYKYFKTLDGIYFENDRHAILTKRDLYDFNVQVDIEIIANQKEVDRYAGLIIDVQNYSTSNQYEPSTPFCGKMFVLNKEFAYIIDADFDRSKILKKLKLDKNQEKFTLKIIKENAYILFYINNEEVYSYLVNRYLDYGKVGLYMNHCSVKFSHFELRGGDYEEI